MTFDNYFILQTLLNKSLDGVTHSRGCGPEGFEDFLDICGDNPDGQICTTYGEEDSEITVKRMVNL